MLSSQPPSLLSLVPFSLPAAVQPLVPLRGGRLACSVPCASPSHQETGSESWQPTAPLTNPAGAGPLLTCLALLPTVPTPSPAPSTTWVTVGCLQIRHNPSHVPCSLYLPVSNVPTFTKMPPRLSVHTRPHAHIFAWLIPVLLFLVQHY